MPVFPRLNRPASQPARPSGFQRIPAPGGATPEQQVTVYEGQYGEMPIPATQYVTSSATLHSTDKMPSIRTSASNASVVDRHDRRNGIVYTAGRQAYVGWTPEYNKPVYSSEFQKWLIGPHPNYVLYACLYRAGYPAATISFGTMRNLALSEETPQLVTRTTGGPGPASMTAAPRFKAVQSVPRYSTMPPMYPTSSINPKGQ